jgi:L-ornithine N5-monooxygenase
MSQPRRLEVVHDIVGIGFGPSNLALAIALAEQAAASPVHRVTAKFLERQSGFGWHRGMLIDDATMQVSFLKDLVTMRNPTSEFSFLCYLQAKDRLVDFINHKNLFPLRAEFHDYLEWAAGKAGADVAYGHEVVRVDPVWDDGRVAHLDVRGQEVGTGEPTVHRCRNLVVATGLRPSLPEDVRTSARIWHSSELLARVEQLNRPVSRFVVVGAGQSAAEVTAHLHDRFPRAEVCAVFSRYGYSPADDSSFANRIFDPQAVDEFYLAPEDVKRKLLDYHGNTNYSVVDIELIDDLYRRMYAEQVLGRARLRLLNVSRLTDVAETAGGVRTVVQSLSTGAKTALDADVVVYATGYQPADPVAVLGDELAAACRRDEAGRLRVDRDYRLITAPEVTARIYLQGGTEHSHGITSSLLSNTAVRAGEILASLTSPARSAAFEPSDVAPEYAAATPAPA